MTTRLHSSSCGVNAWRQERTGERVGSENQPRHTAEEIAAIFSMGLRHPDADSSFLLLFELGSEQRLGQVLRARRRDLSLTPPPNSEG